ncbi:MAG: vWA domain-containing protein [Clostridia bacterium]
MEKKLTELVFILDRSGSMGGLEDETIKGYNSVVKKQSEIGGKLLITTVLFDNEYEVVFDGVEPSKAILDNDIYFVRGSTAMLDAIGKTITSLKDRYLKLPEDKKPAKTIIAITTDGYENASREFTYLSVQSLIKEQKEKDWDFIFLASGIDEKKVGNSIGLSKDDILPAFCKTKKGMQSMSKSMCEAMSSRRKYY